MRVAPLRTPNVRDTKVVRHPLDRALAAVDALSMAGAWASAASILAILALIVGEVFARNAFNYSLYFAWEFSAYFMGAAFMFGAGYALRASAQIRVNVLIDTVPPRMAWALELFATAVALAVCAYLANALLEMAWLSWTRHSRSAQPSELPLWIPQLAIAAGAALLTLQLCARLVRVLRGQPADDAALRLGQDIE